MWRNIGDGPSKERADVAISTRHPSHSVFDMSVAFPGISERTEITWSLKSTLSTGKYETGAFHPCILFYSRRDRDLSLNRSTTIKNTGRRVQCC